MRIQRLEDEVRDLKPSERQQFKYMLKYGEVQRSNSGGKKRAIKVCQNFKFTEMKLFL